MKRIIKLYTPLFLLALIGMFILSFSFIKIFSDFNVISEKALLWSSLIISVLFAIICLLTFIILTKSEKKTKFGHWLLINSSKIFIGYTLLCVFLFSFRNELFLDKIDLKELLSLEWTIMGISIAVFLIWNVVTIEFLNKKMPKKPQSKFPTKLWFFIQEKEEFYWDATMLLGNVYLLITNIIVLCVATTAVYVSFKKVNIFSQYIVILGLFLCTNTILVLVADILKPFNEKKKALLNESKTTPEDIELVNSISKDSKELLISIDAIDELPTLNEEEKQKIKVDLLNRYTSKYDENK